MDFERVYSSAIERVKNFLRKRKINGDAEEFVSEGYLKLIDEKKEITIESLVYNSQRCISKYSENKKYYEFNQERERVCSRCKQSIPIGYFGITVNNNTGGQRQVQCYCRDCAKIRMKEHYYSNRKTCLQKAKSRYQKEKEQLHDNYIRKILRNYGWKTEEISSAIINSKREELKTRTTKKHDKRFFKKYHYQAA